MEAKNTPTINLTADVVAAFIANHAIAITELPNLINTVHAALVGADAPPAVTIGEFVKPTAAEIRKSITRHALISFIDGKPYKILKRHLTSHGTTVDEYKARYGLPSNYPSTAPAHSELRSGLAKTLGLGRVKKRP